jgi:hypothetical protein
MARYVFDVPPCSALGTNSPLEIDFSSYQTISGLQIPLHIQKLVFKWTRAGRESSRDAVVNSGLWGSLFAIAQL